MKWPTVEDATRRINVLIGDQAETDMAARDLIIVMRELGRLTVDLEAERARGNIAAHLAHGRRDLEAENRGLKEALTKISTAARRDTSLVPPDPLLDFIVGVVDAILAAEPASGEAKLEEFDGPIMATLVQNNAALRAQNAELVAERDAAREHGVQARLREKAAEDRRIHDTDALHQRADEATRAENEACAKMFDELGAFNVAAAIRARIKP